MKEKQVSYKKDLYLACIMMLQEIYQLPWFIIFELPWFIIFGKQFRAEPTPRTSW